MTTKFYISTAVSSTSCRETMLRQIRSHSPALLTIYSPNWGGIDDRIALVNSFGMQAEKKFDDFFESNKVTLKLADIHLAAVHAAAGIIRGCYEDGWWEFDHLLLKVLADMGLLQQEEDWCEDTWDGAMSFLLGEFTLAELHPFFIRRRSMVEDHDGLDGYMAALFLDKEEILSLLPQVGKCNRCNRFGVFELRLEGNINNSYQVFAKRIKACCSYGGWYEPYGAWSLFGEQEVAPPAVLELARDL